MLVRLGSLVEQSGSSPARQHLAWHERDGLVVAWVRPGRYEDVAG